MGMRAVIARAAVRHVHVLLVEVPGHWRTRVAVERAVLSRGWALAVTPADADLLAVCGPPVERLADAVEVLWRQMAGPRARIELHDAEDLPAALDEARATLLDTEHHRHEASHRPNAADTRMDHGGMDHGGMDMSPGGLPLAQGGGDRDGLEMDVLNVRLGPVLPFWPAGLVLRCALQGDVIVHAAVEGIGPEVPPPDGPPETASARTMDNVVSLLALAGWADGAGEARRVRDAMLWGEDRAATTARLRRLHRRVKRARLLRWSLSGIRPLGRQDLQRHGLPGGLGGDTYARLLAMFDRIFIDDPSRDHSAPAFPISVLADLVTGLDLATARLVVASLDLSDVWSSHEDHEVSHA